MKFPPARSTCRTITDDDRANPTNLNVFAMLGVWQFPDKAEQRVMASALKKSVVVVAKGRQK